MGNWIRCADAGAVLITTASSKIRRKGWDLRIRDTVLLPYIGRFVPIYREKMKTHRFGDQAFFTGKRPDTIRDVFNTKPGWRGQGQLLRNIPSAYCPKCAICPIRYNMVGRCVLERTMPNLICPICERTFDYSQCDTLPFCSERCRLIDLGRWLDERYGLEYEPPEKNENLDAEGS